MFAVFLMLLTLMGAAIERMLPPEEVSEILSVEVRTLYAWRQAGTGPPATRIGKYLRYSSEGLRQWIEAQESESRQAS